MEDLQEYYSRTFPSESWEFSPLSLSRVPLDADGLPFADDFWEHDPTLSKRYYASLFAPQGTLSNDIGSTTTFIRYKGSWEMVVWNKLPKTHPLRKAWVRKRQIDWTSAQVESGHYANMQFFIHMGIFVPWGALSRNVSDFWTVFSGGIFCAYRDPEGSYTLDANYPPFYYISCLELIVDSPPNVMDMPFVLFPPVMRRTIARWKDIMSQIQPLLVELCYPPPFATSLDDLEGFLPTLEKAVQRQRLLRRNQEPIYVLCDFAMEDEKWSRPRRIVYPDSKTVTIYGGDGASPVKRHTPSQEKVVPIPFTPATLPLLDTEVVQEGGWMVFRTPGVVKPRTSQEDEPIFVDPLAPPPLKGGVIRIARNARGPPPQFAFEPPRTIVQQVHYRGPVSPRVPMTPSSDESDIIFDPITSTPMVDFTPPCHYSSDSDVNSDNFTSILSDFHASEMQNRTQHQELSDILDLTPGFGASNLTVPDSPEFALEHTIVDANTIDPTLLVNVNPFL